MVTSFSTDWSLLHVARPASGPITSDTVDAKGRGGRLGNLLVDFSTSALDLRELRVTEGIIGPFYTPAG